MLRESVILKYRWTAVVVAVQGIGYAGLQAQPAAKMPDPERQFVILVPETPEEYALRTDPTAKGQA
jgi:hypothetical protein